MTDAPVPAPDASPLVSAPQPAGAASPPLPGDDLAHARQVLRTEAAALSALADSMDDRFVQAVKTVLGCMGRVIVVGVGKSGHVGRKIAATFASTGTPAQFVHPTEASHGDLGMITRQDVVLALSNSGNTAELTDTIAYTRRWRIPLIAITGNQDSSLAEDADIVLALPDQPEACPMGLAPTTSTTMAMAMGDALAVALLARRGFTQEDFSAFHPGGKLGAKLVRVSKLMHSGASLPLIDMGESMQAAILEMSAKSLGCVGIRSPDGTLAGIVTDGDLRRHMADDLLARDVADIMTDNPSVIRADALAAEALAVMNERKITGLFALDDSRKPVGFIHIHDCLRAGVA